MSIASLVLSAALAAVAASAADPTALVAKLGSADPGERAAAAKALEALGREALPTLWRQAREAGDQDVRARASALWATIQRGLMTQPSLVWLNFPDEPVGSVLAGLMKHTGLALESDSAAGPYLIKNVPDPAPVAFWEAIDRLGLKFVMPHELGEGKFPTLYLRTKPIWKFTSTDGPFRVALTGLHLHHDTQLMRGPWVRIDQSGQRLGVPREESTGQVSRFYGGLEVTVEPRMRFTQEAPARLTEASDDLGQSLIPEADGREIKDSNGLHFASSFGQGATQGRTQFLLQIPERLGRSAHLRGVVPVMLHLRRPEPSLVIPLADAAGKTFRCDDAEFTIHSVNDGPNNTNVSMTVRLNVENAELPDKTDIHLIITRYLLMGSHQLQLTDASGAVLADSISSGFVRHEAPADHEWRINTRQNGRATHLRYFGMLHGRSEAAFGFRDVPLP